MSVVYVPPGSVSAFEGSVSAIGENHVTQATNMPQATAVINKGLPPSNNQNSDAFAKHAYDLQVVMEEMKLKMHDRPKWMQLVGYSFNEVFYHFEDVVYQEWLSFAKDNGCDESSGMPDRFWSYQQAGAAEFVKYKCLEKIDQRHRSGVVSTTS